MATLEEIREILKENRKYISETNDVKFRPDLMEDKLKVDTIALEILAESFIDENATAIREIKFTSAENALKDLFEITVELYESLDLKPYIYRYYNLEESELVSQYSLAKKIIELLENDIKVIYEACKKNKNKTKYNKLKEKAKKKLQESKDPEFVTQYAEKYALLSELIDHILLHGINKKIIENIETHIEENQLDKDEIMSLIQKYEKAKDKFITAIIG